jgi:hypothetical protein
VGDSAETTYQNEMYVTQKVVDRRKEIHWLYTDARCWKATYGPNTRGWAHLHEPKDADGNPWPEWTGEQPHGRSSNRAREKARQDLWWDIAIPDYTGLADAKMVGERISINTAVEMIMAHLSINIRMCHASQKNERWAVGKQSLPGDITRARGFSRRMGDQIEMIQCIRGRIGGDRDAVLAVQDRPDLGPAEGPTSALSRGKGRSDDAAGECDMEPASPKRARHNAAIAP